MKVKNLTSEMKPLKVVDLSDNREMTIYIEGKSFCDLSNLYVADTTQLGNSLILVPDIMAIIPKVVEEYKELEDPKEESNSNDDSLTDSEEESTEGSSEGSVSLDDKFICDVCGAEFASARGLNSHKSRAHLNEDDK